MLVQKLQSHTAFLVLLGSSVQVSCCSPATASVHTRSALQAPVKTQPCHSKFTVQV